MCLLGLTSGLPVERLRRGLYLLLRRRNAIGMVGLDTAMSADSTGSLENNRYLDALPNDPVVSSILLFLSLTSN